MDAPRRAATSLNCPVESSSAPIVKELSTRLYTHRRLPVLTWGLPPHQSHRGDLGFRWVDASARATSYAVDPMINEEPIEVDPEWFKTFFHGVALDLWRQVVTEEQTRTQAEFLVRTLKLAPPAKVLDVPCGNGRLAVELSARGFRLTGVDIAGEFIEEANSCSAARDLSIEWVHGDMRDLPGPGIFDGAFCWGNSFGYLDDDGNMDFLRSVGRALRPGGRFIIDAHVVAETLFASFQAKRSFEIG